MSLRKQRLQMLDFEGTRFQCISIFRQANVAKDIQIFTLRNACGKGVAKDFFECCMIVDRYQVPSARLKEADYREDVVPWIC